MQFTTKLALLAVLATLVVAQNEGANNGTAPATNGTAPSGTGNGTVLDDGTGSAGNSTNSTTPATNGTATNGAGTSTNGTDTPEPSGGSTRRSLAPCAYECPQFDLASHVLLLSTLGDGTFTCTFSSGSCTYQTETGVLSDDQSGGACRSGAITYTPGCLAGDANNGGVVKARRARGHRRSSREMQYEAIARRFLL